MPQMKNIDSFNIGLIDNLKNIADRRIQAKLNVYLGSKKDQAPNLFPEFYGTTQSGTTQPIQVSANDQSAYDAYLKSK
jgi:hypothetical protein